MRRFNLLIGLISYVVFWTCMFVQPETYQRSSFGPYYLKFKQYGQCEKNQSGTEQYQPDFHLSRRNRTVQVVGTLTLLTPWDDYSSINAKFLKSDSNAGWVSNFYQLEFKGCRSILLLHGHAGADFFATMNIRSVCPIEKGTYHQKGYDLEKLFSFKDSLIPQVFYYGRYKIYAQWKRKGSVAGCNYVVVDVLPKWQKPA